MNELPPSPAVVDEPADRPAARHSRIAALSIAAAVLLTAGAGAGAWAVTGTGGAATTTAQGWSGPGTSGSSGSSGSGSSGQTFGGQQGFGGSQGFGQGLGGSQGFGGSSGSSGSSSSTVDSTKADAQQITGVVTIVSRLGYEDGEAAGTGVILTSSGRILTNNHVISGATSIEVTVESTGRSYTARVVGSDASEDIAVLQLQNASGLTPATIASDAAQQGDDVTAVGNAEGTGTLTAAEGTVTDTGQQITTQSEGNAAGETLDGLIETDADVVSGDSGGPLKNADGEVVGIDTAASSGTADITGYAIPISTALSVAERILAGTETDGIVIGYPAFLGVSLSADEAAEGATIAGVYDGTPASKAGLAAGDVITSVDGTSIGSTDDLSTAIGKHQPGDRVVIGWTDADGAAHTATVVLTEGPAA